VAVPSQDLLPVVSGYFFSGSIEEKDAPFLVVSNNAFHEAIENPFQIHLVSQKIFQSRVH
jgi:hypothetical protein